MCVSVSAVDVLFLLSGWNCKVCDVIFIKTFVMAHVLFAFAGANCKTYYLFSA